MNGGGKNVVRKATKKDYDNWLDMRRKLWPHCPDEKHHREMHMELSQSERYPVFIAEDLLNNLTGFLEAAIHDSAPGCNSSPVGYIEGWFVEEANRRLGIGRVLVKAAEDWAAGNGFVEIASDAEIHNTVSIEAHKRLGYREICRKDGEVKFLKELV